MGDVASQFLRSTAISGNLKTLDVSGGTASALTKASYGVTASGIRQFNPEATATTTATIPAVDGAARDMGWRMAADINAEPVLFTASNWSFSFNAVVAGVTTGPSVTFTAIAYVAGVEIGRGSSTAFTLFASQVVTLNIAAGAVTTGANPRIQVELYANVTLAAVSVGTWTIECTTNHTSSFVDPGVYALRALRSSAATTTPTAAIARTITAGRTGAVTTTPTVALRPRSITIGTPKAVTTTPSAANPRKAITVAAPKAVTTTPTVALGPRSVAPAPKAVTTTPTVAASRRITANRSAAVTTTPSPGFARAVISARAFATTTTPAPLLRLDIPQVALNRIIVGGTPDWPLNAPTKAIAGVTRDSAGAVVTAATVKLVRQLDDVVVSSQTSHATTGAYSFSRGTDDPYSYRVLATKAGAAEIHGVSDVLVPA